MQNIQHYDTLALKHGKKAIHIAADNDLSIEAGSWKSTESGARKLAEKGIEPLVAHPESIRGKKTDYNDVYKRYGSLEVKRQFVPKYTINPNESMTDNTKLQPMATSKKEFEKVLLIDDYRLPDINISETQLLTREKGSIEKSVGERDQ